MFLFSRTNLNQRRKKANINKLIVKNNNRRKIFLRGNFKEEKEKEKKRP